jgi:hypothetical protein
MFADNGFGNLLFLRSGKGCHMSSETIPEHSEKLNSMCSSFNIEYIIIKLEIIIEQLDLHFANAKNLILEIARELDEGKLCKQSQICRKIKDF